MRGEQVAIPGLLPPVFSRPNTISPHDSPHPIATQPFRPRLHAQNLAGVFWGWEQTISIEILMVGEGMWAKGAWWKAELISHPPS